MKPVYQTHLLKIGALLIAVFGLAFGAPPIAKSQTQDSNLSPVMGREGNGGFLYSRTSKRLLMAARDSLLEVSYDNRPKNESTSLTLGECPKPIDLDRLMELISDLDYSYTASSTGRNSEGRSEPRFLQLRNGRIEATKEFFSAFVDTYLRYNEEKSPEKKRAILIPLRTAIIHEGLHAFDYDDTEAEICAPALEQLQTTIGLSRIQNSDLKTLEFLKAECSSELKSVLNAGDLGAVRNIYSCIGKIVIPLKKQSPELDSEQGLRELRSTRKDPLSIAITINKYIRFPFEGQ
jgi:hypothetical protein